MTDRIYQLVKEWLNLSEQLHLDVHRESEHILHIHEGSLSIFFGTTSKDIHNHISKIDIQITQNDVASDFVLFFKNEAVDICAKRKSNLLFEMDLSEMENIIIPFFEMEEIKEPCS